MNSKYTYILKRVLRALVVVALVMFTSSQVQAFQLSMYAENSVLSDGNWVKVSVAETGMHLITTADLKKWGFSDPSKVKVFGYGGQRIADKLVASTYIDDLPQVASVMTSRGLMFYGEGPVTWTAKGGHFIHSLNPFSTVGYYFLTDKDVEPYEIPTIGRPSVNDENAVPQTFVEHICHEKDLVSPGQTGHLLVGEDFKYNNSQSFDFETPDNQSDVAWLRCSFVTKTFAATTLLFTANGEEQTFSSSDMIKASANTSYTHGSEGTIEKTVTASGEKITIGITHNSSVTVHLARLNYLTLNYDRLMKMRNGKLDFRTSSTAVKLQSATSSTHVWDVTDPLAIKELDKSESGDAVVWTNVYTGTREYSAWDESGTFPSPQYEGKVANQNLHAVPVPDMVIFTVSQWRSQAERIAELHRNEDDSLDVLVVNQDDVFNEFSSGTRDVNSFRKMLKMLWDRGQSGAENTLKYALFLGRGLFDNRCLTAEVQELGYPTMPIWQSDGGYSDNDSFTTDDIFAFLTDGSGANISSDILNIAVGRMPVRSVDEAKAAVDKLYKYVNSSLADSWKNQILLVADDDDNGAHMIQTETLYNKMFASSTGSQFLYNKLFLDSYVKTNNQYPEAHEQMMRVLSDGVMFWSYIGHANTSSWSHEGLLTYDDICNLYYKRLPVLYAATCEFMRWDAVSISGGEIMFKTDNGGVIAMMSASRPVFIADNGTLTGYVGTKALERDEQGRFLPVGEILRQAKNMFADSKNKSNSNKLRYALMGDPAMRFTTPSNTVALEKIDGQAVNIDDQVTIKANQDVTLTGAVYDAAGNRLSDFNGMIEAMLFDAEHSVTTLGQGENGMEVTYETQGGRLFAVRDSIIDGHFSIKVAMPSEIASNFRPAALNMFAVATDKREAMGCNRDFYVYGYDETAPIDTVSPTIAYFYLNHESFKSGDAVNESPMVIAHVSDDRGVNLSTAGVGHQITLTLDGVETFNDVSLYYTPDASGLPGGTIAYPLDGLSEGAHTLRLRVWDTSGNASETTIEFKVKAGLSPRIYDITTDVNPASTEVNFYLTHNRPDAMITVKVGVYNMLGREVWSETRSGRSDMFTSFPFNWDLCDNAGRRVPRGIYIYRASISTDDEHFATGSKRLAVTAQ